MDCWGASCFRVLAVRMIPFSIAAVVQVICFQSCAFSTLHATLLKCADKLYSSRRTNGVSWLCANT